MVHHKVSQMLPSFYRQSRDPGDSSPGTPPGKQPRTPTHRISSLSTSSSSKSKWDLRL